MSTLVETWNPCPGYERYEVSDHVYPNGRRDCRSCKNDSNRRYRERTIY